MTNFTSKIFGSSLSALSAQQAKIANAAHNIANVNTEGYTRRSVELRNRGAGTVAGLGIGNGVDIGEIVRYSDKFLEKIKREASSEYERYEVEDEFLSRVENLFKLDGESNTIGSTLNDFFAAVSDLTSNPSSHELRANFIERATDLTEAIKNTYNSLAELQSEADTRIAAQVSEINSLTSQIAEMNVNVTKIEIGGGVATDERDIRDNLINKLSEKIDFNLVEQRDGSVNISLQNGFTLVFGGEARNLNANKTPGFTTGSATLLDGSPPTYITYDYSNDGTSEIDLSQALASGNGQLSGLLNTRGIFNATMTSAFEAGGPIVELASKVESITRALLIDFNSTYIGPDRDATTAGYQTSSVNLNGNTPSVYGLFTFSGVSDVDNNGPNTTDLTASGETNFSSIISLAYSDPNDVHAARDLSGGAPNALTFASGDGSNMEALVALQSTNFIFTDGANFSEQSTLDEAYNRAVSFVSDKVNRVRTSKSTSEANFNAAENRRDSESAVNMDEELTQLLGFQQNYQAAARVITIARQLVDDILGLV